MLRELSIVLHDVADALAELSASACKMNSNSRAEVSRALCVPAASRKEEAAHDILPVVVSPRDGPCYCGFSSAGKTVQPV